MKKFTFYSVCLILVAGFALLFYTKLGDESRLSDANLQIRSGIAHSIDRERGTIEDRKRSAVEPAEKAQRLREKFLRVVESDNSYNAKTPLYCELISEMTKCMSVTEIFAFIEESIGEGGHRGGLIMTLFSSIPGSVEKLTEDLKSIDGKGDDLGYAQMGICENLAGRKDSCEALMAFVTGYPDADVSLWRVPLGLDLAHQPAGLKKRRLEELVDIHHSLPDNKKLDFLKTIWRAASWELPFETRESINNLDKSGELDGADELIATMKDTSLQQMVESSPERTVSVLLNEQETDYAALEKSMRFWLNLEPKTFASWLESNKAKLSNRQIETYQNASISSAIDKKDLTKAKSLATELRDPIAKDKALQQIRDADESAKSE